MGCGRVTEQALELTARNGEWGVNEKQDNMMTARGQSDEWICQERHWVPA